MKKLALKLAAGAVLVYMSYGFFLLFFESSMIYHPDSTDFQECQAFSDDEMIEHNDTRFYFNDEGGDLMVFYHGNAGRACDRASIMDELHDESYMIAEYTGFGERERSPDIEKIEQDVENVADYVEGLERDTYVVGNSLGSSPASLHASQQEVEGLVMINPFYSAETWAWSLSPLYPEFFITQDYNNSEHLENVEDDTLILYSENDRVIPPEENRRLAEEHDVERKMIEGRGHNDIFMSQAFQTELQQFTSR